MGLFRGGRRRNNGKKKIVQAVAISYPVNGGIVAEKERNRIPSRPSKEKEQQSHLNHLQFLSNKYIEEHTPSEATSERSTKSGALMVVSAENTNRASSPQNRHRFQIEPWIEPTKGSTPQLVHSDSLTAPTFCSAFEMLSFDTLCGTGGEQKANNIDGMDGMNFKILGNASDPFAIPRVISFQKIDSNRPGNPHEELEIKQRPSFFVRGLRHLNLVGRGTRRPNRVTKVKVYFENPPLLEHTNSIENSTITWPAEFRRELTLSDQLQDSAIGHQETHVY